MKKIKNIFTLLMVVMFGLSFTACSDDDLDTNPYNKSGVSIVSFGPSPILRTKEIRITGTNMNRVDKVAFPGKDVVVEKSAFNSVDARNIYVNVPDESVPGQIGLVVGTDTVKSVSLLTFEEPIEISSISPLDNVNAGDEITIKGDYVYNIAQVIFTSGASGAPVNAEDFTFVSRREIRVRVPLAAEPGVITLNDGADWEYVSEEPVNIVTASYTGLAQSSADFGQQIRIHGVNLHTVETVMFAGGVTADFTVSDDNRTITTTVPAECGVGAVNLVLYSGGALVTDELALPVVNVTEASQRTDLIEGDVVVLTGENFDRIQEVKLPGMEAPLKKEQYTISWNTLTFTVPEGMSDGDIELKQNAYITTKFAVEMRKSEGIIWQGKQDLIGWSGNWGVFNWDGDKWTKFQQLITGAGQLTVHFKVLQEGAAFQCRMGDWSTPFGDVSLSRGDDGVFKPTMEDTELVINLTQAERDEMFADGGKGINIWGDGIQLQYIKFIASGAERVLWEGNEDLNNWQNNYGIGSDTSPELAALDVHVGQVIRFYGTPTSPEWKVKIVEGHWGPVYALFTGTEDPEDTEGFKLWDLDAEGGCVKLTLTQEILDAAYTQQYWGNTFIVQGTNFILTKVTVAAY